MLYNRGLLLFKHEVTFRTDSSPVPASDAFLVEDPAFTPNVAQLQRQNLKSSLSQDAIVTGRKQASVTFRHEVRSNSVNPPVNGSPPMLGRLLEACAMSRTFRNAGVTVADVLGPLVDVTPTNSAFAGSIIAASVYAGARPRRARITFDSPTQVDVKLLAEGGLAEENNNNQTWPGIAGGITLGAGVTATVTQTVAAATGDVLEVDIYPAAHEYKPMSDPATMPSATLYLYYDGILHRMVGCRGTWSLEAVGADYARFTFTFTGDYVDPIDAAVPGGAVYESTQPRPVELAALAVQREFSPSITTLCAQQFTIDLANEVAIRECINGSEAYEGAVIVNRNPVGSFDPEAITEASFPFWASLKAGSRLSWRACVGSSKGNVVSFRAPSAQISNLQYADRNGTRVYNADLQFATAGAGDDELVVAFS